LPLFLLLVLLISCEPSELPHPEALPPTKTASSNSGQRIVAIGDLHGDIRAMRRAFQIARVMDEGNSWIGDSTRVVQLGDILDRGDHELEILELLDRLSQEAEKQGGSVIVLNGNHEIMNVQLDFRYVTETGFSVFAGFSISDSSSGAFRTIPEHQRGRAAAFSPGGPWARRLARNSVVVIINSTAFVHGGLLPEHARLGIETINEEVREWMLGHIRQTPDPIRGPRSPVWVRDLSLDPTDEDCRRLRETLHLVGADRLVVGHTVQEHINCACDSLVWRVDTGMAAAYGGPIEVLEITESQVRILR
jgi:hypothetical protein